MRLVITVFTGVVLAVLCGVFGAIGVGAGRQAFSPGLVAGTGTSPMPTEPRTHSILVDKSGKATPVSVGVTGPKIESVWRPIGVDTDLAVTRIGNACIYVVRSNVGYVSHETVAMTALPVHAVGGVCQ